MSEHTNPDEHTPAPAGTVGPFDVTPEAGVRALALAGVAAVKAGLFFAPSYRTALWVGEVNGPEFDQLWETVTDEVAIEAGFESADAIPTHFGLGAQLEDGSIVTEFAGLPVRLAADDIPTLTVWDLFDHLATEQAA